MKNVGFLPENPYIYPYLTPREFVDAGRRGSAGSPERTCAGASKLSLERTGIAYAADRQVRRLSKGMLQRTGLAAAMVSDPELLSLDEPMSGLDPVGRKEVRDLIFEEKKRGKTVFFSTHILSDVETLCDRVVILRRGETVVSGTVRELLRADVRRSRSDARRRVAPRSASGFRATVSRCKMQAATWSSRSKGTTTCSACSPRPSKRERASSRWRPARRRSKICSCAARSGTATLRRLRSPALARENRSDHGDVSAR